MAVVLVWLVPARPARAQEGVLTLQVGVAPPDPVTLVAQSEEWRYRKGTSEPPADWTTVPEASLDGTWLSGPGGIGFGDGDDATVLGDMQFNYLTYYTRRTFTLGEAVSSNLQLRLTVDWDDGFVAYLDGVLLTNSPNVTTVPHPFNAGVFPDHPAIVDGGALGVFDLGPVGDRLGAGEHVLAVQGINGDLNSSDTTLNVNLLLVEEGSGGVLDGDFALVEGDSVFLSGTNTLAGATRVTVNGREASFDLVTGQWSHTQTLRPGMNSVFVAASDAAGNFLGGLGKEIVSDQGSTEISGPVGPGDNSWSPSLGLVRVTGDVTVPAGSILDISPGMVLLLAPGAAIEVEAGGVLNINGTAEETVWVRPADAASNWDRLAAAGADARLFIRHADISRGQVLFLSGAEGLLEDSHVHDYFNGSTPIVRSVDAAAVTVRRSHLQFYHETLFQRSPIVIEDSLFENAINASSDALDFDGAPPGSVIRRTTFRNGLQTNTDAIDIGPTGASSIGVIIEDCLMHGFADKGVSIGEDSFDITVRNCLIWNTTIGVQVKDVSTATIHDCTIVDTQIGLHGFEKTAGTGGGRLTNTFNNILAFNQTAIAIEEGIAMPTEIEVNYSDTFGTNWPSGVGNINADPLFVDATARNYRLQPGSPCIGTGKEGTTMGMSFPVGGLPPVPFNVVALATAQDAILVRWEEDADNEEGFVVERSVDGRTWTVAGVATADATEFLDAGLLSEQAYQYQVRATNFAGLTRASNLAGATTPSEPVPETVVGGTLTENTFWTTNDGTILVFSDVVVPEGVTLNVGAGVEVRLTNDVSLIAQGGILNVLGTRESPVRLAGMTAANWDQLTATGASAAMTLQHAEITQGRVRLLEGAVGLIEDCYIHDYLNGSTPIINSLRAGSFTLRRCHVSTYHETLFQVTLMLIEDCLFENAVNGSSDAIDFDGAPPGSVIRRSTLRNGTRTNTDAIDLGPTGGENSVGVVIEDCIMYNFSDKGVSIGENSLGITVRNCLIYDTGSGVQVKDVSTATIHDCTILDSVIGLHGFEKSAGTGGGRLTNTFNNILAFNTTAIAIEEDIAQPTEIVVHYSDTLGTNWPSGVGNINLDPLFVNRARRDYRLRPGSPCIGTGQDGTTMGVSFPIGGLPAVPGSLQVASFEDGTATLAWEDSDSAESGFLVEVSTNAVDWVAAVTAPQNATLATVGGLESDILYFFRVSATNFIGASFASELAGTGGDPDDLDGDGMPNDYEVAHGFDANNPADAGEDSDNDGASNLDEFLAGTDPRDPNSLFQIESVMTGQFQTIQIRFRALANRSYTVWFKEDLNQPTWQVLVPVGPFLTDRMLTISDSPPPSETGRFYKLSSP